MSFDHFENKLIIQDYQQKEILSMSYSTKYRLISGNSRSFLPITYTYRDNDQKLLSWKIGSYYEEFLYDTRGRLIEIQRFNELSSIKYSYGQGEQVRIKMNSSPCIEPGNDRIREVRARCMPI